MILKVNPTRMELLRLRRRLGIAQRGHKLLKDKQDELVRQLVELARTLRRLRRQVEEQMSRAAKRFILARATMEPEAVEEALLLPTKKLKLGVDMLRVMNVRIPRFEASSEGRIHCYGFYETSGQLDAALSALDKALDRLVELAEKEKSLEMLAQELERTRRRVNALEHVMIPNITDTIRHITDRLAEMERGNISRLMRVKEIVRAH